jgi:ABC-2 type transport system ATP-binding protein
MTSEPVLETTALQKHFGKIHAVDGVNLSINSGEIYGLLGPNGSGNDCALGIMGKGRQDA